VIEHHKLVVDNLSGNSYQMNGEYVNLYSSLEGVTSLNVSTRFATFVEVSNGCFWIQNLKGSSWYAQGTKLTSGLIDSVSALIFICKTLLILTLLKGWCNVHEYTLVSSCNTEPQIIDYKGLFNCSFRLYHCNGSCRE
jgi:hypothetical protein